MKFLVRMLASQTKLHRLNRETGSMKLLEPRYVKAYMLHDVCTRHRLLEVLWKKSCQFYSENHPCFVHYALTLESDDAQHVCPWELMVAHTHSGSKCKSVATKRTTKTGTKNFEFFFSVLYFKENMVPAWLTYSMVKRKHEGRMTR